MFCKKCGAELKDNEKVCSACGTKQESGKVLKIVVAVVCLLVLAFVLTVAVLVATAPAWFKAFVNTEEPTETAPQTQEITEPTLLINYDSHTASNEDVAANRDAVVATVGDYELTGAQLQLHYWFQVYMYQEKYISYISAGYMSLDVTKPLDKQACAEDQTISWQDFFLKKAFTTWQSYAIMNMLADEEGFELEASVMEGVKTNTEADALAAGYENAEDYVTKMLTTEVSTSTTVDDYWEYMEFVNRAQTYFAERYEAATPTADEMEAYYTENEEDLKAAGAGKDAGFATVDVRHILIMVDENSEAGWKQAEQEAQEIMKEYESGEQTEERFAELANKYSEDGGSNTNGGLYSGVSNGQMVEVFNNWIMDTTRKPGDTDILKADDYYQGYHIMYFVKGDLAWEAVVKQSMLMERSRKMLSDGMEKWPIEKIEENIKLGTPTFDK